MSTHSSGRAVPVGLRIPPELAAWLKDEAAKNHRSVANQTAWVLQQYRQQQEQRKPSSGTSLSP
ncbi:hypothetical protein [Ramlibacter sp.]|uniref:hypothetical protein n=1 Tax=Ramlibacter sp. TaxID=1917967 RepID=UPI00262B16DA|nr:hypothetical protein [Ramlibacter sp.]MDB5956748.1 hypothetical protein [Ramlibacter sp.]